MLVCCWSVKGGVGTTVVAALLALGRARAGPEPVLVIDLCGDVASVLGAPPGGGAGLADWLRAADDVDAAALGRLETDVGQGLRLLARGSGPLPTGARLGRLSARLASDARLVVVDAGRLDDDAARILAAEADRSLLVLRPCYLAIRRAVELPLRPSGVVLVSEPGRVLGAHDVEEVVGAPVLADIAVDPAIARAVDAGLLAARVPRGAARALGHAL